MWVAFQHFPLCTHLFALLFCTHPLHSPFLASFIQFPSVSFPSIYLSLTCLSALWFAFLHIPVCALPLFDTLHSVSFNLFSISLLIFRSPIVPPAPPRISLVIRLINFKTSFFLPFFRTDFGRPFADVALTKVLLFRSQNRPWRPWRFWDPFWSPFHSLPAPYRSLLAPFGSLLSFFT